METPFIKVSIFLSQSKHVGYIKVREKRLSDLLQIIVPPIMKTVWTLFFILPQSPAKRRIEMMREVYH